VSTKETGGPAFPEQVLKHWADLTDRHHQSQPEYYTTSEGGMTLRDYFAAKAMQADLEYQGLEGREDIPNVAAMAYYMADAMLAERAK
jgi:hypothetical protein